MRKFLVIGLFLVCFSSCSEYQKLIQSNDFPKIYSKAVEYYNAKSYNKALNLFEMVSTVYSGTSKAQTIAYYRAFCLYNEEDYINASELFKQFVLQYPESSYTEECFYMMGYCDYLASPRPLLDQTVSKKAVNELENYISRYPESSRAPKIKKYINELNDKLSYKSYLSASNYYLRERYKAAVISLENCINDYPNSKYMEKVMSMLFDAKYEVAVNSIEAKQLSRYNDAMEEYYYFKEQYPKSKYLQKMNVKFKEIKDFVDNYKF